jgi:DNA repair exonuclease SbcCD nuclease subunit
LNEHPHIVYAGNLQGRNARECGDKGAVLVEVEDNEVSSLKRLPVSRVCWASLTIDLSDIKTEDEAFESYRQAISNEVTRSHQLPLICRVSIVGATPMHRHLHEDRGRLRDELKAAADQCREDIWLEDVRLATSEPITVHGAQANATGIDLSAMLSHILSSLELFDEAKAELHTITSKMPTAALAAELSDERIPCHRRAPYPKPESVDASGRRALSTPHRRELRRS